MANGIGLMIFATARYRMFLEGVVATARRHWHTTLPLSIVTFTDEIPSRWISDLRLPTPHADWPLVTLLRYRHIYEVAAELRRFDYLLMCDVDMEFVGEIGDEILGDLVATRHAGHTEKTQAQLPYIRMRHSTAWVPKDKGLAYYAGGFQGGRTADYLEACRHMAEAITEDEKLNYIADWHDESHWNAYLANVQPAGVELSPAYCWPSEWDRNPETKILALSKEHAAMREKC